MSSMNILLYFGRPVSEEWSLYSLDRLWQQHLKLCELKYGNGIQERRHCMAWQQHGGGADLEKGRKAGLSF